MVKIDTSSFILPGLIVSVGVIIGTLFLSEFLRRILNSSLIPSKIRHGISGRILLEFVATFELLAIAFERGVLGSFNPSIGLPTSLFFVFLWRTYYWRNVKACPYSILEEWICNQISILNLLILVAAELAGGFVAFSYFNKQVWSLGMSDAHLDRFDKIGSGCTWSLVKGDYVQAACYEAGFAFAFGMTCRFLANVMPKFNLTPIIRASVFTSIVMSGGIINPVLASALQFGCSGITLFEHVIVYWIGTSSGAIASYYVWKFIYANQRTTVNVTEKKKAS